MGEEAGKEVENFSSRSSQTPAGSPGNPALGRGSQPSLAHGRVCSPGFSSGRPAELSLLTARGRGRESPTAAPLFSSHSGGSAVSLSSDRSQAC